MATSFNVNIHDLQYILRQIKIAEASSAAYNPTTAKTILQAIMDEYGVTATNAAQLPAGLRTVDGSFNSLVPGQENLGAADMVFPRLLDPVFIDAGTYAGSIPGVTNTNYANPGNVVDSDPRTISNLIVDQTAANPAAVMAALQYSVFSERITPAQVAGHANAIALAQAAVVAASDVGSLPADRQAAVIALNAALVAAGIEYGPEGGLVIPNLSPDIGLSPGFNAWMTFFGQFFDHGLDLVTKGGNGKVYIPLAADDPLIAGADKIFGTADDLPAQLRFMELTRATTAIDLNGDGDTLDAGETGNTQGQNTTTSFVDQNQTYTSHASHQVFLREYVRVDADTVVSTGKLLDGKTANGSLDGAIGNWAEVKAQALSMLGIKLTDYDVGNVPWLRTDQYGKFIPAANGYAQVIIGLGVDGKINTADDVVVVGTAAGIDLEAVGALRTGHAFLNDIAHHAGVGFVDLDHNGVMNGGDYVQVADADVDRNGDGVYNFADLDVNGDTIVTDAEIASLVADVNHDGVVNLADVDRNNDGSLTIADFDINGDTVVNAADLVASDRNGNTYDNEMLDSHFVTGDGRGNENIALTTVHSIFHSEHNRLVDVNKQSLIDNATTPAGLAFLNEWLLTDVTALPADLATLNWDGERLFQAARFSTEMQYQHLVFEEFARRVQPMVDPFIFNSSPDVDPSIVAEFAHTVYRFGHSMLTDTVDRLDADLTSLAGDNVSQETLIAAFLNPQMYIASGATLAEANADIIRGLTRELGNEMDEFVVPALQSNLLGLPLDLPALNMARGRDTGVPSLNETRAQLYNDFGFVDLKPYASWNEFAQAIKNPTSVINFVAAYGTHTAITSAATLAEKRLAAYELVTGADVSTAVITAADRTAFLNATGAYAAGAGERGGLDNVDLWIGGLAEKKNEFGGMLGSTFNFIFEYQMENLQNGDRLYYLTRTQGLNILNNLEPNSFADMVMRNTELGDIYATHLSGQLFITPDHIIELDRGIAQADLDPVWEGLDSVTEGILGPKVVRDYTGATTLTVGTTVHDVGGYIRVQGGDHYVIGGTEGADRIYSDSGIDTIWGDGGNDYINAGTESDDVFGGLGDDIIEDPFGDDVLRGNQGNDVISSARGADLLFGDEGNDYIILGQDASEAFGGEGDDFILGGNGKDFLLGNEGSDWIEGGGGFDTIAGENSELFFNSTIIGHDVLFGQGDETDYDAESGDDIMGSGASVFRYEGMFGFDWAIAKGDLSTSGVDFDFAIPIFTTIPNDILKDRFDQVEGASGGQYDDDLSGDDRGHKGGGSSAPDSVPVELFAEHLLTQEGINRIAGFNQWFGGNANGTMDGTDARITLFGGASPVPGSTPVSTFRDGNILLGGDGNDFLRGRGGYDLLDGDAYLNVRIKIVHNGVTYSAESMSTDTGFMGPNAGLVFATNPDGSPNFASPAFGGASLSSLLLNGTINPGSMSIVREILTDNTNVTGVGQNIDTAIFQGTMAEYEIEGLQTDGINYTGQVIRQAQDLDGDGFIFVRDKDTGAVGAVIQGLDADGNVIDVQLPSSRGLLTDDRDLLKNIEQLQFADRNFLISGPNRQATGTVTIGDPTPFDGRVTPYVGQVLVPTLSGFADLDGIPLVPVGQPGAGLPVGLNFEWQTTEVGNDAGWSTIQTSQTYTVRSVDPGHILRAVAVFQDSNGVTERIYSVPTDNPTVAFSVNENSLAGTVVGLQIPFNVDYDAQSIGGNPPPDVDLATLHHEIDQTNDAGDRFTVVLNGVDFNGNPRYSLVVNQGGPVSLDYEAVQAPVDNQYQVVINTYDAPGGTLVAVRQFTILLNDIVNETVVPVNAPTDINWNGVRPGEAALPGTAVVIANLSTVDVDSSAVTWSKIGGDANITVSAAGAVARTGGFAVNSLYTLNVQASETANPSATVTEAITIRTGTAAGNNGVAGALNGSGLTDVIYALGGNDLVNGLGGNDVLFGQAGADTLNGGAGNDDLTGGTGNDAINGGAGNDTIRWTFGDGNDVVDGGADTDTLIITGTGGGETLDIDFDGTSITQIEGGGSIVNVEQFRVDLLAGTDTLNYSPDTTVGVTVNLTTLTASGFTSIAGIENVSGSAGNDTLIGVAGAANALAGQGGNDTFTVHDHTGPTLDTVDGGGGTDLVQFLSATAGATYTITNANVENLTLLGAANINGTGNGSANVLTGNSGNNTLNGAGGNDTAAFAGPIGNYTFGLSGTNVTATSVAEGTDTLTSIENLQFGAQAFALVAGTNVANAALNGGGNADIVLGFDGADTINGGAGNDIILAGAGADVINYAIGGGADTVDGGGDSDTLNVTDGGGNSTLDVIVTGTTITSLAGGTVAGVESVTAALGGGTDTLSYAGSTSGVTVNLATGAATGFTTPTSGIENVTGTAQADILTGSAAANTLSGGGGIDNINGGAGGDIIIGGDGADVLNSGAADDNVADVFQFVATTEFGDTVTNFDANGTATQVDRVDFGGALNTAYDDGLSDDNFLFVTGTAGGATTAVTVGQANANAEALLLISGVATADLGNAGLVSAAFNSEFVITGAGAGEDALLVVDASDGDAFALYQWVQAGGGETTAAELTLIGTFAANAQVTAASFDFFT